VVSRSKDTSTRTAITQPPPTPPVQRMKLAGYWRAENSKALYECVDDDVEVRCFLLNSRNEREFVAFVLVESEGILTVTQRVRPLLAPGLTFSSEALATCEELRRRYEGVSLSAHLEKELRVELIRVAFDAPNLKLKRSKTQIIGCSGLES